MLEKAYRAGFRMLLLGIESASDRILKQLNKGFNTKQIQDAFTVFRQFPFFYHAYFIYGNVSETEEEMMAIPEFARELGVHTINLSMLRVDHFSPLRQLVESTPGYYISKNGKVYSREFDRKRLGRIRNRIRNRFMFRPGQLAKILTTVHNCNILTYWQIVILALTMPLFFLDYVVQKSIKTFRHLGSFWRQPRCAFGNKA
jgi:hypothetical protein